MQIRPILATGVALASAGAIVAATPAVLPTHQEAITTSVPAPLAAKKTLTVGQLRLLALTDVTWQDIVDVFNDGYGGGVTPDDDYYPVPEDDYPIYISGVTGLAYYLGDQALDSVIQTGIPVAADVADFLYNNFTSYYYEISAIAALHVALAQATGGPDTDFAQFLQFIFNPTGSLQSGLPTTFATLAEEEEPPQGLGDLTWEDIVQAYEAGYGGGVLPDDPYYPTPEAIFVDGVTGVTYRLTDAALWSVVQTQIPVLEDLALFAYDNVTSYYFEIGGTAALHVALAQATDGPDGPIAQVLKQIFNPDTEEELATSVEEKSGPELLPKKQANVIDVSVTDTVVDKDAGLTTTATTSEEPDEAKEDIKPVKTNVKKGPVLSVKKDNPLAGAADDFKDNLSKTSKAVSDSLKKLTEGFGKQDKDEDPEPEAAPDAGESEAGE